MRFFHGAAIVASLALGMSVAGWGGAARAEPPTLRIGWIAPPDAPLELFGVPGIARHSGVSYRPEFIHFAGSPPAITALASASIDLTNLGFSTFPLAVENAKLEDLRILVGTVENGMPGRLGGAFIVLNDGPIHRVEDLKGRIVSSNAAGGAIDIAMRAMLLRHGLKDKRDYTFVEAAFPNLKAMLIDRKTDLVALVPPFSLDPALNSVAHPLFTSEEAMGPTQDIVLAARSGVIEKKRGAIVDFLEDELRARHWYLDPSNHDEAVAAVARFTKTPPSLWSSWAFTPKDMYRDPDGLPDLEAMQRNITAAHELGFVPAELDPRKYADLSLVEEAAKRLK